MGYRAITRFTLINILQQYFYWFHSFKQSLLIKITPVKTEVINKDNLKVLECDIHAIAYISSRFNLRLFLAFYPVLFALTLSLSVRYFFLKRMF